MNPGDMILVRSHSYPEGWKEWRTDGDPHRYPEPALAVFLSQFVENEISNPRIFYRILTPMGVHVINSAFCQEVP